MGQLGEALREPLRRRIKELASQQDVAAKLHLVAEADLRTCLAEGINAVATIVGVEPEVVVLRLPADALNAAAIDVGLEQQNAIQVLNENQSDWAATLEGLAGFGLDLLLESNLGLGGMGIGRALSSVAGGKARETRTGEALVRLATKLNAFEALVEKSAAQLDVDPVLAAALSKKNDVGWGCLLFFLLGCAAVLGALGYLGWRGWKWAFSSNVPAPTGSVTAPTSPPPRTSPLVGNWTTSSGQSLRAFELDDAVEFDITYTGAWADQGFAEGEMRFRLRRVGDAQDVFTVEDKTRPTPSKGVSFAAEAAESCHVIRSTVGGIPLRARLTGDRLIVESVRSTLPSSALRWRSGAVIGCDMERAAEAKVETTLNRSLPRAESPRVPTDSKSGPP